VDVTPRAARAAAATPVTAEEGQRLATLMGCAGCHSADGMTIGKVGPTWKGLFGSERQFVDGTRAIATEEYLRQSIREPAVKIVKGFDKSDTGMPSYAGVLTDSQIEALILYIRSLK
jgi:mono/diheme cytochrome c family protein